MIINEVVNPQAKLFLAESWNQYSSEQQDIILLCEKNLHSALNNLHTLLERELTTSEIEDIWKAAEEFATEQGDNRTLIGKGADVTSKATNAVKQTIADNKENIKAAIDNIGNSKAVQIAKEIGGEVGKALLALNSAVDDLIKATGITKPLENFDKKYQQGKQYLAKKFPETAQQLEKLQKLGEENPKTQMAIMAALSIAAGATGGWAAAFALRSAIGVIQGKDPSEIVTKGIKSAGFATLVGAEFGDADGDVGAGTDDAGSGDSDTDEDLSDASPEDASSDEYWDDEVDDFNGPFSTAELLNDLASESAQDIAQKMGINNGEMTSAVSGVPLEINGELIPKEYYTDQQLQRLKGLRDLKMADMQSPYFQDNGSMEYTDSKGRKVTGGSVKELVNDLNKILGESTAHSDITKMILAEDQRLDEINWKDMASKAGGALKKGAKAVGGKIADKAKEAGHELGNKVTVKKLQKLWKKYGKPADSDKILDILRLAGMTDGDVNQLDKQFGISKEKEGTKVDGEEIPAGDSTTHMDAEPAEEMPNKYQQQLNDMMTAAVNADNAEEAAEYVKQIILNLNKLNKMGIDTRGNDDAIDQTLDNSELKGTDTADELSAKASEVEAQSGVAEPSEEEETEQSEEEISSKEVEEIFKRAIELMLDTESDKEEQETNTYKTPKDFADRSWAKESRAQSDITTTIMEVDSKSENLMKRFMDTWKQYHNAPDTEVITAVLLRNGVSEEILQQLEIETVLGKTSDSNIPNDEQDEPNKGPMADLASTDDPDVAMQTSMDISDQIGDWEQQGYDVTANKEVHDELVDDSPLQQHAVEATPEFSDFTKKIYAEYQQSLKDVYQKDNKKGTAESHGDPRHLAKFLIFREKGVTPNYTDDEYYALPEEEKAMVDALQTRIEELRQDFGNKTSGAKGDDLRYAIEKMRKKQPKIDKE